MVCTVCHSVCIFRISSQEGHFVLSLEYFGCLKIEGFYSTKSSETIIISVNITNICLTISTSSCFCMYFYQYIICMV